MTVTTYLTSREIELFTARILAVICNNSVIKKLSKEDKKKDGIYY